MSRAVILARVSDPKQKIKGDSLEDQQIKCNRFIDSQGWIKDREFTLIESGRKGERKYFWEIFDYCKSKSKTAQKIDYLLVLNIGRFTRGGGEVYLGLKRQFEEIGVTIKDIYQTVGEKVNTLEDYGQKYDWSIYSPSEPAEVYEANQRRDYVRAQLTQMISGCIRNIRKGYWNGPAIHGLATKKVETKDDGQRSILVENQKESIFIKKIFEMRSKGFSDNKIMETVNSMGFKTRIVTRRDKRTMVKIGTKGGVKLTVKKIQEYVVNPIYCGIICVKWTDNKPVKAAMFDGFIDIDTFNSANRGKVWIDKLANGEYEIKKNIKWSNINQPDKRTRNNPLYPYKNLLLCPICKKPLKASASKGRSGEKFPTYFCDREHSRWHQKRENVHNEFDNYLNKIKFTDNFKPMLHAALVESWNERKTDILNESELINKNVEELRIKQKNTLDLIKSSTVDVIRKALEKEYIEYEDEISSLEDHKKGKKCQEDVDIRTLLKYADYLMEHQKELLIDRDYIVNQTYISGLIFDELPTYENVINGTAKLNEYFQLKQYETLQKFDLVHLLS